MCIKAGDNELQTVKNLMGMSLMAVVAEALDVDLDAVTEESRLVEDLNMSAEGRKKLKSMVADIFEGAVVNLNRTPTVSALLDQVVLSEFAEGEISELAGINQPHAVA